MVALRKRSLASVLILLMLLSSGPVGTHAGAAFMNMVRSWHFSERQPNARPAARRDPNKPSASCMTDDSRQRLPVELTPFGKRTRTIVFTSLGGGTTCGGSRDWRDNLPRYLGRFTGATVIVYDARDDICRTCWSPSKAPANCMSKLRERVDLLVVLGSGKLLTQSACKDPAAAWCPAMHLDLRLTMGQPFARKALRTVHFPIRNMDRLMNNKAFDFDVIIDDSSFAKPMNDCALMALEKCVRKPRENALVYVARLVDHKGQLSFIKKADPELLKGYTIEFYGQKQQPPSYVVEMKEVAREKGIRVRVEGRVGKSQLFRRLCSAKGLVIHSVDKNPRSVYEGVVAGLPAFVSKEAQLSSSLTSAPFVVATDRDKSAQGFNDDLRKFMEVMQHNWTRSIVSWRKEEMSSKAVYQGLCQRMGVCAPGKFDYEPWDFGEFVKPKRRMTAAEMRLQKHYILQLLSRAVKCTTNKIRKRERLGKSARDSPAPEDRSTPTIGDGAAGSDKAGLRGVAEVRTMNMTRQTLVGLR
eukprot:jgi/Tetstr1/444037/TSEL_031976.t1